MRPRIRFAGYAALFDRVDRGGDVIRAGAFADATAASATPVPVLWQHDGARVIGAVERLTEDARGLRVVATVDAPVAPGTGLSFGYRSRSVTYGTNRELLDLELIEVSLVARPMQPLARVLATQTITQGETQ